jgi:RimJ/RimL family protein N-acetyltransferase
MNLQTPLSGRLVILTPLEASNFEALYRVSSDPLIWEQHPNPDRHQREIFETFFSEALASQAAYAIRNAQTHEIIGSSRYYQLDLAKNEVAIGYTFLARKYWGGPFNTEVKRLMIHHAFQFVEDTIFHVGPLNFRSQRAMEKLGAEALGPQRVTLPNGTSKISLVYRISRH